MGKVLQLHQYRDIRETYAAIVGGRDFRSGEFYGMKAENVPFDLTFPYTGSQLPDDWRRVMSTQDPDYVVFSYLTPIAWHYTREVRHGRWVRKQDVWVVPDIKYRNDNGKASITTGRHQNIVIGALGFNELAPIRDLEEVS